MTINNKKIVIVIPFANEDNQLLRSYMEKKRDFLMWHREIHMIFVNDKAHKDCSKDAIFFDVFGTSQNCLLFHNDKPESLKGGAVLTGLSQALRLFPDALLIGFTDLDDSLDLEDALFQIVNFRENTMDVYLAIRENRALRDLIFSKAYSLFVKLLFPGLMGIKDLHACWKFFAPCILEKYFAEQTITDISWGFEYDLLLYAIEKQYKIQQFKVGWKESKYSARTLKNIVKTVKALIKKRFFNKNSLSFQFYQKDEINETKK